LTAVGLILFLLIQYLPLDNPMVAWFAKNFDRALEVTGPTRLMLVNESWALIAHSPVIGYGMDQGDAKLVRSFWLSEFSVHNAMLKMWVGGGVFAFLGSLVAYGYGFRLAISQSSLFLRGQGEWHRMALAASMVGWMLIDMIQPTAFNRFSWISVAMLYGLSATDSQIAAEALGTSPRIDPARA